MRTVSRTFTCASVKVRFLKNKTAFTEYFDIPCAKSNTNRLRGYIKELLPEDALLVDYDVLCVFFIKCTMPIIEFIQKSKQTIL